MILAKLLQSFREPQVIRSHKIRGSGDENGMTPIIRSTRASARAAQPEDSERNVGIQPLITLRYRHIFACCQLFFSVGEKQ